MINNGGQMFIHYEKELDKSNQMIKNYGIHFGDDRIKKDVLNKAVKKVYKRIGILKKMKVTKISYQ